MTTEKRFLSSTLAAYGSQIGRAVLRAGSDVLLARLIVPKDHGLFEVALGIAVIAGIFRDLGLGYQLIRDERKPYGTVFAWTASAGALLAVGVALSAPLFGSLFEGRLTAILPWFAIYIFLDGLAVVPKLWFERRLEVGRLVGPELLRGLTIATIGITLAFQGAGVWALVWGELAGAALFAALLWGRAWGKIPLDVDLRLLPKLIRESGTLFLIALAALPMPYIARFALSSKGAAEVGYFGKARGWGFRLQELVLPAVARVLYPALVEYRNDRPRFLVAFRLGTVSILALETLAAYFLFFNAHLVLVGILLGPAWERAVPILQALCFVPLTDPMSRLGGELLKVEREDRIWLAIVLLNFASLLGFGIPFAHRWGGVGVAWAHFLLLGNLLMTWRVARIAGAEFWRLARDLAFVYLLPLPMFLLAAWLLPAGSWGRLAASLAACAIAGVGYLSRFRQPFREFFFAVAKPE